MFSVKFLNNDIRITINSFPKKIKAKTFKNIELLKKFGNQIDSNKSKKMKDIKDLFELRTKAEEGISRCFYCFEKNKTIYIIHAFIKKDDKTSPKDIEMGKERLKELKEILDEVY